jgi:hypothetical protein
MESAEVVRARLLGICDERYKTERWKDRGAGSPNPSKLIAEGIRSARAAVEGVPLSADVAQYLAAVQDRLAAVRDEHRKNPTSEEGWTDEDGWILGGLATIAGEVDREKATLSGRGLRGWVRRLLGLGRR